MYGESCILGLEQQKLMELVLPDGIYHQMMNGPHWKITCTDQYALDLLLPETEQMQIDSDGDVVDSVGLETL
jgi:hypothetical protein